MKFLMALATFLFFITACTKTTTTKKASNKLPYDSAIEYVYEELKDKKQAAMVGQVPVSWSQLRSQDPALNELEERYNSKALAFVYAYALMSLEQKASAKINIEYYGEKPETELKDVLTKNGLEVSKEIEINYEVQDSTGQLAKVGDKVLTTSDFIKSNLNHSKLYRKVFNQRMQRLNGIVVRRFILQASKAENVTMEDYVKQKILGNINKATEADVRDFAKKRGISESDLNEKMIERLKEIVDQEKRDEKLESYVGKSLIKEPIKVSFVAPQINIKAPTLGENVPQWGKGAAAPHLLFVGHWSCDDCEPSLKSFLKVKETWGKKVNGAFIYSFPERDREARMGAEAALCVFKQSQGYFWLFMDKMINSPKEETLEENINAAAQSTGADFEQFRQCFLQREFQQAVDTHLAYAKEMGVFKTPLMVIDGQVLEPPLDSQTISSTLRGLGISNEPQSFFTKIKNFFAKLF